LPPEKIWFMLVSIAQARSVLFGYLALVRACVWLLGCSDFLIDVDAGLLHLLGWGDFLRLLFGCGGLGVLIWVVGVH
jgi:hypothetical protein